MGLNLGGRDSWEQVVRILKVRSRDDLKTGGDNDSKCGETENVHIYLNVYIHQPHGKCVH